VPFVFALALLGAYEIRNRIRSSQLSFEPDDGEVAAEVELGRR
jgi:glycosyltransferase 2 family protein